LIQYLLPFVCLPYVSGIWSRMKQFLARRNRRVAIVAITRTFRQQHLEPRM
jgi:hypothetical protein